MTMRILLASCGVVAITVAGASAAFAQGSARPYRGLFGDETSAWTQMLSASGSASAGYDTAALSQGLEGLPAPSLVPAGVQSEARTYSLFSGGLSYSYALDRLQVGASLSSAVRHYPQLSRFIPSGHSASVGTTFSIWPGSRFGVSQSYSAQPAMLFQPFAPVFAQPLGQVAAPDYDFIATNGRYTSYGTGAEISQDLWRSSAISASYGRQFARFSARDARYESQTGGTRFTQGIARGIGLRLGYGFTESRYSEGAAVYRAHNIDVGIDYNRPISLSRRTRLSLTTGTAALSDGRSTRYQITGSARLTRDIGRTWQAVLGYGRNAGFYESLRAPYFYDSADAGIGGLFGRRVSFQSSAGILLGDLQSASSDTGTGDFDTLHAGSNLSIALTRYLALAVDYAFYRSWFDTPMFVGETVTPQFHRNSVRVSLKAWAPIVQRGRRDGASR